MGFTGAHMLYYVLDVFILALYLLSHVCALLEYTFQHMFGQDFEVEVCQYFAVDVRLRWRSWIFLVSILKLGLVKILSFSYKMLLFGWDFEVIAKSRFFNSN